MSANIHFRPLSQGDKVGANTPHDVITKPLLMKVGALYVKTGMTILI